MSERKINVDGSGKDGAMTFWEPNEMRQVDLVEALDAVGLRHLAPKRSVLAAALQDAVNSFFDRAKIKVRGRPIRLFPLSQDVVGFDARQINPGSEEVDPVFVASVLLDDNGNVRIPKHNSAILPQLDNHRARVEGVIESVFHNRLHFYPTSTVSSCIARVIQRLQGILVRRTGGYYFVPGQHMERFETFAKAINSYGGPEVVTVRFPLVPTETSYATVLKSVKNVAKERTLAVETSLRELGTNKQRGNGKESRLKECQDVLDLLKDYEEILGVELSESKEIVAKVEAAVNAHAALEFCP